MVYVAPDGSVHENRPSGYWMQRGFGGITDMFWGFINFVVTFFRTLVPIDGGTLTGQGGRRSDGGGPGGPGGGPRRRTGGISTLQDCDMPGGG